MTPRLENGLASVINLSKDSSGNGSGKWRKFMYRSYQLVLTILRVGIGLFFLIVGVKKSLSVDRLEADIIRFDIVPVGWEWLLACLGIAVEIVIGVCFLFRKMYAGASLLGLMLTGCFVGIFVQGWIRGLSLSCNCLGVQRDVENYFFEVTWRVLLLGVMLLLFRDANNRERVYFKPVRLDFSDVDS